MSKKVGVIIAVVAVIVAAVCGGAYFLLRGGVGGSKGDKVYVEKISSINGAGSGAQNRYSGTVEPQKTWEVKKNPEKTVKALLVQEGDMVEVGTPLFEYDTDQLQGQIAQANLELEGIDNEIAGYRTQIESLQQERKEAPEDQKFQYTTQIQTVETSIKQAEYNKQSKNVEIKKLQESLENAVVTSELAGVIKQISENGFDPYTGSELPYISVLATGDFRVKGLVNEMNVWSVNVGAQVLIRSRVDEQQTWTGTISEIDTKPQNQNGGATMYDGAQTETATKYPFYVALDDAEGLMLGQHVYIEMDFGQADVPEGVWLFDSYVVFDENGRTYVWADDGRGRIEKRTVELGEYKEDIGMYEILSGLTLDDYVTYPMASLYEGVETVTNPEEVDYNSPIYQNELQELEDGVSPEDGMMDGELLPEGESLPEGGTNDGQMSPDSTTTPQENAAP